MKFYSILHNDKVKNEEDAWVVCADGFSIIAFAFNVMWAFYRNLWVVTISLLALLLAMNYAEGLQIIKHSDAVICRLMIFLYVGLEANDWYLNKLQKSGYVLQDIVLAKSANHALLKFYSKSAK